MDTDRRIEVAVDLMSRGAYAQALEGLEYILADDPGCAEAWYRKAQCLVRSDCLDEALPCYDESLRLDAGYPEVWVEKGWALFHLDRREEALACMDRAIALDPDDPGYRFSRGRMFAAIEQWPQAAADFDAAIAGEGEHVAAFAARARAHEELGDLSKALADRSAVIELDDNEEARLARAQILYRLGRMQEARRDLDKVAALQPVPVEARLLRARILAAEGEHAKALREYRSLLTPTAEASLAAEARRGCAESLFDLGKFDQACQAVRHARQAGCEFDEKFIRDLELASGERLESLDLPEP